MPPPAAVGDLQGQGGGAAHVDASGQEQDADLDHLAGSHQRLESGVNRSIR